MRAALWGRNLLDTIISPPPQLRRGLSRSDIVGAPSEHTSARVVMKSPRLFPREKCTAQLDSVTVRAPFQRDSRSRVRPCGQHSLALSPGQLLAHLKELSLNRCLRGWMGQPTHAVSPGPRTGDSCVYTRRIVRYCRPQLWHAVDRGARIALSACLSVQATRPRGGARSADHAGEPHAGKPWIASHRRAAAVARA